MITSCHLPTCTEPSHVVLFASGAVFGGQPTTPAEKIALCLRHGGEVYALIHALRNGKTIAVPGWLASDRNRLPRITPDPRGWADARPAALTWSHREFRTQPGSRRAVERV